MDIQNISSAINTYNLNTKNKMDISKDFREIIENQKREILKDDYDWWTERMLRHKMFMQLRLTGEIDARLLMDLKNNTASSYVLSLFSPQLSQEELEEKKRIEKEYEENLDILQELSTTSLQKS